MESVGEHYMNITTQMRGYVLRHTGKFALILMAPLYASTMYWYVIPQSIEGNLAWFNVDVSYQGLVAEPEFKAKYWADFREANLRGGKFINSGLGKANLQSAKLEKAELREANLQGANLFGANLQNASLRDANLQNADLSDANLQNANITYVHNLTLGQLTEACVDATTVLPEGDEFRQLKLPTEACENWEEKEEASVVPAYK